MNKNEFQLKIAPNGAITAIYDDDLAELFVAGQVTIKRASFVEPDENGQWIADLAPSGGPVLGPFTLRQLALDAEREWLEAKLFGG